MLQTGSVRWRILVAGVVIVLGVILVRERHSLAASFVGWSSFELVDAVYFDRAIDSGEREAFLRVLAVARRRVAALYGPLWARPLVIAAQSGSVERFGAGSTAVTHYQPWRAVIVFGPDGRNVDVAAHELAHAELLARIGYARMAWCVPTWFDEGLAVHFDERPFYSERAWNEGVQAGLRAPPLDGLGSRAAFFSGSRAQVRHHYALARHAIGAWLLRRGEAGARRFIAGYDCAAGTRRELERIALPN